MTPLTLFLIRHGYAAVFAWVFVEQIGAPIPAAPILLAAGALGATGHLSVGICAISAWMGAMASDTIWFQIGRNRGNTVLGFLCRISLQPDSCARRTQNVYSRYGASSLLLAKFVPWLNAAAPPLAGAFRMRLVTFLIFDSLGVLLWEATYLGLGYAFGNQVNKFAHYVGGIGALLFFIALLSAVAAYFCHEYLSRKQFLRQMRMARITAGELKRKLDSHEDVAIVDLRHPLDLLVEPYSIPGSIRLPMEEVERRHSEIPRDRDVVLYCTCPSEATSAMTAKRLVRFGITRVRPLVGGFFAWREHGFPLEPQFAPVPAPSLNTIREGGKHEYLDT